MSGMSMYDSTKESLQGILAEIHKGKIQLPEFQRDWVWDDAHISSLLASVTLSYPIGVVMTLETGGDGFKFLTRLVHGVEAQKEQKPEMLILDGQQRLTALYQSLYSSYPVETKDIYNKPVKRHYHVNIDEVLSENSDREDVIISLPSDRLKRNFRGEVVEDYSTMENQCRNGMLPLDIIMHDTQLTGWQMRYLQIFPEKMQERLEKWNKLLTIIINPIKGYQVPLIKLRKETPREAVCQVFEKVNTGGVPLTVFELLTATFAAEGYNLREDWTKRRKDLRKYPLLLNIQSEDFLQSISLFTTKARRDGAIAQGVKPEQAPGISCKRREILKLQLADYKQWADKAQEGFVNAAKFLHLHKLYFYKDLPYRTQLVPLASTIALLGHNAETEGAKKKLSRWFWSGVIGQLYGSASETRFAKDFAEVALWVMGGGTEPSTIADANFQASRLFSLRTRNSATYKGIYALLMQKGCLDFRTGDPISVQSYFDEKIDIHHIFPQKWCIDNHIPREKYDSIINKTALSARTNRMIGGRAPSSYLKTIEKNGGTTEERLNEILSSHGVNSFSMRTNDFDSFFAARIKVLLELIEEVLGKAVTLDHLSEEIGDNVEELERILDDEIEDEESDIDDDLVDELDNI